MRYLDERVWVILNELRPLIDRQHIDITNDAWGYRSEQGNFDKKEALYASM